MGTIAFCNCDQDETSQVQDSRLDEEHIQDDSIGERKKSDTTLLLEEHLTQGSSQLKRLMETKLSYDPDRLISHVVIQIVVDAEIRPLLDELNFQADADLSQAFLNLAIVFEGNIGDLRVSILKVAESKEFGRHYSGYSQSAAIAGLIKKIMEPDLVISFGTCGGFLDIGDVVLGTQALFVDRIRLSSDNSFNWGVWGGQAQDASNMVDACGLKSAVMGSQISYQLTKYHVHVINECKIECLDMECAPIAQILNQVGIPLLIVKVVSNGIYPDNPDKMEQEYKDNRELVCANAVQKMREILNFLQNKRIGEL